MNSNGKATRLVLCEAAGESCFAARAGETRSRFGFGLRGVFFCGVPGDAPLVPESHTGDAAFLLLKDGADFAEHTRMLNADELLTEVFKILHGPRSDAGRAALASCFRRLAVCVENNRFPDAALLAFVRATLIDGAVLALHGERPNMDFDLHRPAATALVDGSLTS